MAQTTPVAVGTTAVTSADINIPANEVWHIGIFTDNADFQAILNEQSVVVLIDTPSTTDSIIATLTRANPVISIRGKATVRVKRPQQPAGSVNLGVFLNDQA